MPKLPRALTKKAMVTVVFAVLTIRRGGSAVHAANCVRVVAIIAELYERAPRYVCPPLYNYLLRLATHSLRLTAAADLIEARKVLALPKPRSSVLNCVYIVYQCLEYGVNVRPSSL